MFTHITPLLRGNRKAKIIFLLICFFFLSAYPIYKNYINGEGINTYENYKAVIEKRSPYYNPWQYRIFCPILIAGAKYVYDHTIDKVIPVNRMIRFRFNETSVFTPETSTFIRHLDDPDIVKCLIIFMAFRFLEDFIILLLSFYLLIFFVKNYWLAFLGLIIISWSMGNGVNASDLTFNTYLDNILYLLTGCIILYKKNLWYILPITMIGAANRETSLLIPYLVFISNIHVQKQTFPGIKKIIWPPRNVILVCGLSAIVFIFVFVGLRIYFGYRPQQIWKVPAGIPMLKLNLFTTVAIKGYFEMFGVFSVFPLICLYKFRKCSEILKVWFVGLVPIWFLVHFYSVVVYESRLFFVPTFLIFLPMVLEIIEKYGNSRNISIHRSSISTTGYISG